VFVAVGLCFASSLATIALRPAVAQAPSAVGAVYIPNSYGKVVPPGVAYRVLSATCPGYANRVFNSNQAITTGPGTSVCALSVLVYPQAQQP
jgi:hypothetical protein